MTISPDCPLSGGATIIAPSTPKHSPSITACLILLPPSRAATERPRPWRPRALGFPQSGTSSQQSEIDHPGRRYRSTRRGYRLPRRSDLLVGTAVRLAAPPAAAPAGLSPQ